MATSLFSPKALSSTFLFIAIIFLCFSLILAHGGGGDHGDDESDHKSESGTSRNLRSKSLNLVKVYCLIIMFVSTFVAGFSPYFYRWNESFLLLGTQFAGGVFLATSLIHFLSDANETFESLGHDEYPYAFMLASAGYLLTMLSDCVVALVANRGDKETRVDVEDGNEVGRSANPVFLRTTGYGDTILLILALCFHSIFEGIAIGVSDTKGDAWRNLWTISLHKIFAAIAMGIALLKMIPKRPFLLTVAYSFAFGISSPIGVGIGIGIDATTEGPAADWTYAISMGLACGIFVYVAINHLIAKGFKPLQHSYFDTPFFKFLAVLLGIAVIAVVMIWD